ncbi:hypothetical protein I7I50_10594 [Histoplasma capsulatum G186AR]|uniref:Uncharacterized protein n=1 Tax=Ajellomyces capsulatus TaxID=5037 RepID=A0A8H7Z6L9_AJECA|nr:hypothetical protein I7I52_01833 [Histoplasma capsulatum]QSS69337.1 hypothetical protein I7I50_10594 [Histoplasma capsulatum G186AR]
MKATRFFRSVENVTPPPPLPRPHGNPPVLRCKRGDNRDLPRIQWQQSQLNQEHYHGRDSEFDFDFDDDGDIDDYGLKQLSPKELEKAFRLMSEIPDKVLE